MRLGKDHQQGNTPNILIVDDSEHTRSVLRTILEKDGYVTSEAVNGVEALAKLNPDIDLVFMDAVMPDMDGFETTYHIRQSASNSELPIIMVTSLTDHESRIKAISLGVNDFVSKPFNKTELKVRTETLLQTKAAQDRIKRQTEELECKVTERTRHLQDALTEVQDANNQIQEAYVEAIKRLCNAAEYRDNNTGQHIKRVCGYSGLLAHLLGLPEEEAQIVKTACAMHDIGKIGIPDNILLKRGKLTPHERTVMQQHTIIGASILRGSKSRLLQAGEIIALSHHEKWDGSGYPYGLAGENIPLYGRICILADTFDALTSARPYKKAFSNKTAFRTMAKWRGEMYDPMLYDLFISKKDEILDIQRQHRDNTNTAFLE